MLCAEQRLSSDWAHRALLGVIFYFLFLNAMASLLFFHAVLKMMNDYLHKYEPRCEKTGLQGFRPGPTQTGLYSHRRLLET